MNKYICPEDNCEGLLELSEYLNNVLQCPDCEHTLTEETAEYLFDKGMILQESEDDHIEDEITESDVIINPGLQLVQSVSAYQAIRESDELTPESLKEIYTEHIDEDIDDIDFVGLVKKF